jgi:hypothetical protein
MANPETSTPDIKNAFSHLGIDHKGIIQSVDEYQGKRKDGSSYSSWSVTMFCGGGVAVKIDLPESFNRSRLIAGEYIVLPCTTELKYKELHIVAKV